MALPPKEIRYRKNVFYLFIAMGILPMAGASWVVLTTRPSWQLYLPFVFSMLIIFFVIRHFVVMTKSDRPVLIFESHALTINSRKPASIPWSSITQWKIRNDKANYKLVIRTASRKISVEITWLDVPAKEIGQLMEEYLRQYRSELKRRSDPDPV